MRLCLNERYETMPWNEIDAVVFDVGNVLLSFAPMDLIRERLPERPELHELILKKTMRSPCWLMLDRGTATQEEAIRAMVGRDTALEPYIRRVMGERLELDVRLEEGMAALKKCREKGKKLYVLSNFHRGAFAYVVEKHPEFQWFDGCVVSAHLQLLKPDLAIYRHLIRTYNLDPAKTLFIDDTPANVEAALESGWRGLCYLEQGVLKKFFELDQNAETLEK